MSEKSEVVIAAKKPAVMELEPGTYYFCSCGRSASQPFCDGSHSCTDFKPIEFKIEEQKRYALCTCKHSAKQPFCDGKHKDLP